MRVDGHLEPFARAVLDEELLRACALHDVRGALTSIWSRPVDPVQDGLLERVAELLREVGAPPATPWPLTTLWGALAEVLGAPAAHDAATAYAASGVCEVSVTGNEGLVGGWTLVDARAARAAEGEAWRRARVRMAARLCGVRMQVRTAAAGVVLRFAYLRS